MLWSCQSQKTLVENPIEETVIAPSWVNSTPISSLDYIGIGRAAKIGSPEEYALVARKSALNELASQIEVTVTVNSLMYTLEHDDRFSESFSQQIDTRTDLALEGFEVYDSWEDEKNYWVYYRLSKSKYQEIKAQKKRNSLSKAASDLNLARQAKEAGNVELAADYYAKAIVDLQDYWGEDNPSSEVGTSGSLDKIALEELMNMRNDYKLTSNTEKLILNEANSFRIDYEVKSMLNGQMTIAVPFVYRIGKGDRETLLTNTLSLTLRPGKEQRELLSITADPFKTVRSAYPGTTYSFLRSLLKEELIQQEIEVYYPAFSLSAQEKRFGETFELNSALRGAMATELANMGIAVEESSPYVIRLSAVTRDGGMSQGFHVAYMDVTVESMDTRTGQIRFSQALPSAKGVHKTIDQARVKSQDKAKEFIDKNLLYALLDATF
jgi:hypothetical protein